MTNSLLGQQAAELTNALSRLMRAIFTLDSDDPTMELPVAQLRACNLLSEGPRTISRLARDLGITVSAVTQIADRLEAARMAARLPGTRDRRTRTLRLTDHGERVLRSRRQQRVSRASEVLSELSPPARRNVLKALSALLDASTGVAPGVAGDGVTTL